MQHRRNELLDLSEHGVFVELLQITLVAFRDFYCAVLKALWASHDPQRNAGQICVGEHDAGTHLTVIVEYFNPRVLQIFI